MKNSEKLKTIVEKKFSELQEYTSIYTKKAESQKKKLLSEIKEKFKENPEEVDVKSIAKNMFFINGFHQADIRKLQVQLLDFYNLVKEIEPKVEFNKEIVDTILVLKNSLPQQLFTVDKGELKEIEKCKVSKMKQDFEDKNYFALYEQQIKNILND